MSFGNSDLLESGNAFSYRSLRVFSFSRDVSDRLVCRSYLELFPPMLPVRWLSISCRRLSFLSIRSVTSVGNGRASIARVTSPRVMLITFSSVNNEVKEGRLKKG